MSSCAVSKELFEHASDAERMNSRHRNSYLEGANQIIARRRKRTLSMTWSASSTFLMLTCCLVQLPFDSSSFLTPPRAFVSLHWQAESIKPDHTAFFNRVVPFATRRKIVEDDDGDEGMSDVDDIGSGSSDDIDDEPEDVPADWSEDDILAGFEEEIDVDADIDIEEEEGATIISGTEAQAEAVSPLMEEDDEDDFDDVDFDQEEDIEEEDIDGDVYDGKWLEEDKYLVDIGNQNVEWDEDDDAVYELEDDLIDPDYTSQKIIVEQAINASIQQRFDESFDPISFAMNDITPDQERQLDLLPFMIATEDRARPILLTEGDLESIDLKKQVSTVPDLMSDDPYPRYKEGEVDLLTPMGISEDDMEALDETYKLIKDVQEQKPWDRVMLEEMNKNMDELSNQTIEEMEACLGEIGGSAYNVTRWLLYDLNFNISNLILAAVKHNREAPILFQHWYPQLVTYSRYKHAQDRHFDFTWEDVEKADISELVKYYQGFGYDEIPSKPPAETGIIGLEDLDEEEIKMASFENWVTDVYNPECDRKDFDDDDFQDEDNVFSEFYEPPQHPDLPSFRDAVDDVNDWEAEMGDFEDTRPYRDRMGKKVDYEVENDPEFEREFRGHLVIACTGMDSDLEVAEKITLRFQKEFGKKVFVETRVMALAREEDSVFEIWLESYEVDLLHSKRRATSDAEGWKGPATVDDVQLNHLVDKVGFLISDKARYSYRWEFDFAD